MKNHFY